MLINAIELKFTSQALHKHMCNLLLYPNCILPNGFSFCKTQTFCDKKNKFKNSASSQFLSLFNSCHIHKKYKMARHSCDFRKKVLDQNGLYINTFQSYLRNVCLSVILEFCLSSVVFGLAPAYISLYRGLKYLLKVQHV